MRHHHDHHHGPDPRAPARRRLLGALATLPTLGALGVLGGTLWGAGAPLARAQQSGSDALPKSVRIGYQKGGVLVLIQKQGVIEKRLKALGVSTVQWVEFPFGPPMLEALGAGAIDLGSVGDTPPIFAQAGGGGLVYAASTPSSQHAVLVRGDSPIKTVAELKGKKVAFGKGSSAHNVTIKALTLAGLRLADITPVYLPPADATAAFNGGNVDAWTVWDPYFAIAQNRYGARAIADTTSDPRLASAAYYMARQEFAARYPNALLAVLEEIGKATVWAGQHRDQLATLTAQTTGIDVQSWTTSFARAQFAVGPITDANITQQQQLADSFYALNIIPRKITVSDIVWRAPGLPFYAA